MLDEAGWVCAGPVAGRGGPIADANTEGTPADKTRREPGGPGRASGRTAATGREAGEEVLDGIRLQ